MFATHRLLQSLNSSSLIPTSIVPSSGRLSRSIVLLQNRVVLAVVTQPEQQINKNAKHIRYTIQLPPVELYRHPQGFS